MPILAEKARLERLMEAWRVLSTAREDAQTGAREREIAALGTAMAIVDAAIAIEEGLFAERGKFGELISNPDAQVLARLREIAGIRDIFAAERPQDKEEAAE
jgi:hypothetical protein